MAFLPAIVPYVSIRGADPRPTPITGCYTNIYEGDVKLEMLD